MTVLKTSVLTLTTTLGLSFALSACNKTHEVSQTKAETAVSDGYIQYLNKDSLAPYRAKLPAISNDELQGFLTNDKTIWYNDNEGAMRSVYQDSVTTVLGLRLNTVGYEVGDRHRDSVISKLLNYFQPKGFRFPFYRTAGTDDASNYKMHTLWLPPRDANGKVLPVLWWMDGNRYRWTFPIGTYFAEILYVNDADDSKSEWYPYEIRTRKRYADGWAVDVFRPFPTAESLAKAIEEKRPNWQSVPDLAALVNHLRDNGNLKATQLDAGYYAKIFDKINGATDELPAIVDKDLIKELLTTTKFVSATGAVWKSDGKLETYAAATSAGFSIVPKGYKGGLFPVNEESCSRCHNDTGRYIGELDDDVQLYGEIWGDDWIFSWNPFQTYDVRIDSTFENNEFIDARLIKAGLVKNQTPPEKSDVYKPMRRRFTKIFR